MSRISLRHVHKSFPKNPDVIKDLSLEILDREFLVLVGASGSGKTTTLRLIAGLEEITAGELLIDGVRQTDADPSKRGLGCVCQNYALLPNLTVYDNIAFGLLETEKTRIEKKQAVEAIARKLVLFDKLGHYPSQLSGGQRQRVALARALVDRTALVLFDEPLSNLDAVLRTSMRNELVRNHRAFGVTSIYVTHDQLEAMAMASRIALLEKGKILQVGTPDQMYRDPCHLHVAQSFGTPEANVLTAEVKGKDILVNDERIDPGSQVASLIEKRRLGRFALVVRPEDIGVFERPAPGRIRGMITRIEDYGMSRLLHVQALKTTVRIRTSRQMRCATVYFDLGEKGLLFNEHGKRIRSADHRIIRFDREPTGEHDRQVLRELKNYGYDLSFHASEPTIRFDAQRKRYVLRSDQQDVILSDLADVLSRFSYRPRS